MFPGYQSGTYDSGNGTRRRKGKKRCSFESDSTITRSSHRDQHMQSKVHMLTLPILHGHRDTGRDKTDMGQNCIVSADDRFPRGEALSRYAYGGGSVQEIYRQPKNIILASLQPKNITSFYT